MPGYVEAQLGTPGSRGPQNDNDFATATATASRVGISEPVRLDVVVFDLEAAAKFLEKRQLYYEGIAEYYERPQELNRAQIYENASKSLSAIADAVKQNSTGLLPFDMPDALSGIDAALVLLQEDDPQSAQLVSATACHLDALLLRRSS